jgi:site-specific DNA recombinase
VARLISPDDDGRLEAARTEHARVLAERDDLYDQLGRGGLSAEAGARAEPAILARLAAAAATLQTLETPPVLRGLLEPGADVAQRWDDSPVSTRREVLRALFVPDLMGEMRIVRSPVTGRAAPVGDRVEWKKAAG